MKIYVKSQCGIFFSPLSHPTLSENLLISHEKAEASNISWLPVITSLPLIYN